MLCNCVTILVSELGLVGTDIHQDAIKLCLQFKQWFSKYGKFHNIMNSTEAYDEEKIREIGKVR